MGDNPLSVVSKFEKALSPEEKILIRACVLTVLNGEASSLKSRGSCPKLRALFGISDEDELVTVDTEGTVTDMETRVLAKGGSIEEDTRGSGVVDRGGRAAIHVHKNCLVTQVFVNYQKSTSETFLNVAIGRVVVVPNTNYPSGRKTIVPAMYKHGTLVHVWLYHQGTGKNYHRGPHRIIGLLGSSPRDGHAEFLVLLRVADEMSVSNLMPLSQKPQALYYGPRGAVIVPGDQPFQPPPPAYCDRDACAPHPIGNLQTPSTTSSTSRESVSDEEIQLFSLDSRDDDEAASKRSGSSEDCDRRKRRRPLSGSEAENILGIVRTPPPPQMVASKGMRAAGPVSEPVDAVASFEKIIQTFGAGAGAGAGGVGSSMSPYFQSHPQSQQQVQAQQARQVQVQQAQQARQAPQFAQAQHVGQVQSCESHFVNMSKRLVKPRFVPPPPPLFDRIRAEPDSFEESTLRAAMADPLELAIQRCDSLPLAEDHHFCGHPFDSKLEQAWCLFMHLLGVRYMPEGMEVRFCDNQIYTPDFFLPRGWGKAGTSVFVEIKGDVPDTAAFSKAAMVPRHTGIPTVILAGSVGVPFRDHERSTSMCEVENPYRTFAWAGDSGRSVPGGTVVWVMREDGIPKLDVVEDPSADSAWAHPRLLLAYRTALRLMRGVSRKSAASMRSST